MRGPEKEIRPEANGADSTKISGQAIYSQDSSGPGQSSPDAPTWDEYVGATVEAQVVGYRLGYQHGLRDAADELDAQVLRDRAAAVVLNAAKDMHVVDLRRPA